MSGARSRRRGLGAAVVAVSLLLASVAGASDVTDLYSATVAIQDRSNAELARGAQRALVQVIVKLTGARSSAGDARIKAVLRNASKLMLQYAYGKALDGALTLHAEFDAQELARELAASGIGVWGKERPDTLLWLIIDSDVGRRIAASDEPDTLATAAALRAQARAVPVLWPLLDIEDAQRLSAALAWPALADAAYELGRRYATPATLVGHVIQSAPSAWSIRWRLFLDGETLDWTQQGELPEQLVADGIDGLGDALGRRYATPDLLSGSERLRLTVVGVRSADDYARVAHYFGSLDSLSDTFVVSVSGAQVVFDVTARGGRAALAQAIGFGNLLAPVPAQTDVYELRP